MSSRGNVSSTQPLTFMLYSSLVCDIRRANGIIKFGWWGELVCLKIAYKINVLVVDSRIHYKPRWWVYIVIQLCSNKSMLEQPF